jgi:hypothetical protein
LQILSLDSVFPTHSHNKDHRPKATLINRLLPQAPSAFKYIISMAAPSFYAVSDKDELNKAFVGKDLKDIDTPAAVLDLHKIRENCKNVLEAAAQLGFGWRAHIKTHKVGNSCI